MGDELGDEWWKLSNDSGASEDEQQKGTAENLPEEKKAKKRGMESKTMKQNKAKRTKKAAQEEGEDEHKERKPKRRRKKKSGRSKKKTITDVLATSEPKAGTPADLQKLVRDYYSDKRSVIELEDLQLPDSCFLASNDLTHSLSSYLKEICPKWAKVQRLHTEKRSLVLLIICSSALRTIELIKQLTAYKGEAKVIKLFAKHIKVEEQVKLLDKSVTHIGVGTPGRVRALIEREGLGLQALRFLVLDWNWRDQKQRRMVDIPEVRGDLLKLMEVGLMKGCQEGGIKLGLF